MLLIVLAATLPAQGLRAPEAQRLRFTASIVAHAAGTGFDAWTSWQHVERNGFLSDNGRFTARSAGKKAGVFAFITLVQVAVVKKWGKRHRWLEKAFTIANFTSAGMYTGAGVRNLKVR
jgi:hypothetical protein